MTYFRLPKPVPAANLHGSPVREFLISRFECGFGVQRISSGKTNNGAHADRAFVKRIAKRRLKKGYGCDRYLRNLERPAQFTGWRCY